jgi:hypothetical protein
MDSLLQTGNIYPNSYHWRRSEATYSDLYPADCDTVGSLVGHIERF